MRHILSHHLGILYFFSYNTTQEPKMPKKPKKNIDKMNKTELHQEVISATIEARKRRVRMNQERRIAKDLNDVIKKWHDARLPKEIVVGCTAYFMVNFIFDCYGSEEANHLLITAISRELIHSKDIEESEIIIQ